MSNDVSDEVSVYYKIKILSEDKYKIIKHVEPGWFRNIPSDHVHKELASSGEIKVYYHQTWNWERKIWLYFEDFFIVMCRLHELKKAKLLLLKTFIKEKTKKLKKGRSSNPEWEQKQIELFTEQIEKVKNDTENPDTETRVIVKWDGFKKIMTEKFILPKSDSRQPIETIREGWEMNCVEDRLAECKRQLIATRMGAENRELELDEERHKNKVLNHIKQISFYWDIMKSI